MTTHINLLPWREMRRREMDRQFLTAAIGFWIFVGILVFYAHLHVGGMVDHQNNRNAYLNAEIKKLDKKIKEIRNIRRKRANLIARMEVIQQLQADRTEIVHVFDDLVRKLPKGIYFTSLTKKGKNIQLNGLAQSNARISSLMQDMDSSDWFSNPNLRVINVRPAGGTRVSKFTLNLRQQKEKPKKQQVVQG